METPRRGPEGLRVLDHTLTEFEGAVERTGADKFRARQIFKWLYGRHVRAFEKMTDLPRGVRESLKQRCSLTSAEVARTHRAADGTEKILLKLADGNVVEAVLIPEPRRRTVCVSTQVGCPVACVFCASGLDGLKRNLTAGEIVEQVLRFETTRERSVTHLVIMGIGEPLLNYSALTKALTILHAPWGLGIGYNKITLSTSGIADKISKLIQDGVTPNLAVSLHAPNDELRAKLVPGIKKWGFADLVAAAIHYRKKTGKDVTFEYVLLAGVNDAPEHARELAGRVRGAGCKVNVIPYNRVEGLRYEAPGDDVLGAFVAALGANGVPVTVRRRRGDDVGAACGQLRAQFAGKK